MFDNKNVSFMPLGNLNILILFLLNFRSLFFKEFENYSEIRERNI